jgi:3',5'-cyclic AMP phosphodiesterase CpdA
VTQPNWQLTRRQFLSLSAIGGAGLILGCNSQLDFGANFPPAPGAEGPSNRRIWAFSDSHIGLDGPANDEKDGADYLKLALDDVRKGVGRIDYALGLGDLADNAGAAEQLKQYAAIRDGSSIPLWFEIAGNHDYGAVPAGDWRRYVRRPNNYLVLDGNAAFFMISAQQGRSNGIFSEPVRAWLSKAIPRLDGYNIIVCSHQPVYDTVRASAKAESFLEPREAVAAFLDDHHVDLWLCGHIHAGRRNIKYIFHRAGTTFINVSSICHAYGTGASTSYVLEMEKGGVTALARCRWHEQAEYLDDQEAMVEFRNAWRFSAHPAALAGPAH